MVILGFLSVLCQPQTCLDFSHSIRDFYITQCKCLEKLKTFIISFNTLKILKNFFFVLHIFFSEVKTPEEKEKEEQELLNKYYEEYKTKLYEDGNSEKGKLAIPRFYFKVCFNALCTSSH